MDRWSGKVAIVIGLNFEFEAITCIDLVHSGLKVVVSGHFEKSIEELDTKSIHKTGKLYAVNADLTKEEDILAVFKWTTENIGPVSILINNAGCKTSTTLINGDTQKWKRTFDTNVMASLIATRKAIKIMEKNNIDGHIVQINSVSGLSHQYYPKENVYPATKHAMRNITEVLRAELNERQSRIKLTNIYTGRIRRNRINSITYVSLLQAIKETISIMRSLTTDEVADTIIYALSSPPNVNINDLTVKAVHYAV